MLVGEETLPNRSGYAVYLLQAKHEIQIAIKACWGDGIAYRRGPSITVDDACRP